MARPKEYKHRVIFSSSIESNLLEEFEDVARVMKVPRNEALQQAMRILIAQKNLEGSELPSKATPIKVRYDDPTTQWSLLDYMDYGIVYEQAIKMEPAKVVAIGHNFIRAGRILEKEAFYRRGHVN